MMEDICERMMGIARGGGGGGESLSSQKVVKNLSQRLHDDEFWSEAVSWDVVTEKVVEKRSLSLKRLIECTYALCNAVIDDYESLSRRVVRTIRSRTAARSDCVDGGGVHHLETAYGIELYLR